MILCFVFLAGVSIFSNWKLGSVDTSNEWNKVGVVLRVKKRYEEAEKAFKRAIEENPSNPNSYLNLAVLYDTTGRLAEEKKIRALGHILMKEERDGREQMLQELKGR